MGRGIAVVIGSRHFPTKGALTQYIRMLIGGYGIGSFLEPAHLGFCQELFQYHPEAESKIGPGIAKVEVRLDDYGHRHFQVYRTDGTDDDISWVHCVKCAG